MGARIKVPKFKLENGFETTLERSNLMKKIKSSETKAEVLLRRELWKNGFRYRINVKKLPGSPDIVSYKHNIAIFVDGEFWHGYNWGIKKHRIKTNRDFWIPKIERNMQRDIENSKDLQDLGFKVFRFWEHEIKADVIACVNTIIKACNAV